jgi:hypothetical protein
VLLLVVALDASANPSLRRLVTLSIDDIGRSLSHDVLGLVSLVLFERISVID